MPLRNVRASGYDTSVSRAVRLVEGEGGGGDASAVTRRRRLVQSQPSRRHQHSSSSPSIQQDVARRPRSIRQGFHCRRRGGRHLQDHSGSHRACQAAAPSPAHLQTDRRRATLQG